MLEDAEAAVTDSEDIELLPEREVSMSDGSGISTPQRGEETYITMRLIK